ncbi:MAG: HPF/RaiA family ribosome-associated protein [Chloroflexota bacterium]|nr:HPF/RaiA family ribosome-associated protein [Chloroflexota bacterium]
MPEFTTDLDFEFYSEDLPTPDLEQDLWAEAWERVQALAGDHDDMIGASAAVERVESSQTPHVFLARIVAYIKPQNIVVKEKADGPMAALQQALDTLERQVRERREKRGKPWEKPKKP